MTVDELTEYFTERKFDLHGRARGRSGACHLVASYRDTWDHGDKECRVFFGARIGAGSDYEWIRYKFSVSRSALASEWVRKLTGDQEAFLLEAGLLRFQRFLLEDDSPGRSEEMMLTTHSSAEQFEMRNPCEFRSEVSRVQLAVLDLLWENQHRGIQRTDKLDIENHACTASSVLNSILDSFQHKKLIDISTTGISIRPEGQVELEQIRSTQQKSGVSTEPQAAQINPESYDVFISHASEDKDRFVRPLAEALRSAGIRVWYDEFALTWGAGLRQSIDHGLAASKYGVVVLSHNFFAKDWPQKELNGLFATMKMGERRILPIWHELTQDELTKYSPMLSDLLAVNSTEGVPAIVEKVVGPCKGGS